MATLDQIFNHLVLPPKLPGSEDADTTTVGHALLQRLLAACDALSQSSDPDLQHGWDMLRLSLEACRKVNNEILDRPSLKAAFQSLLTKENHLLVCYLATQNAALLIHRHTEDSGCKMVVFEAFEASPPSKDVLAAPNALRWQFPSRAVQIPAVDFDNEHFQSALASFLDKAGAEQLSHLAATAHKAGKDVSEIRDSGSPALITHMLLSTLMAIGRPANVSPLEKRVHDDVSFASGGATPPWRRSPFWLVLRVAAQRQLRLAHDSTTGHAAYKLLITTALAHLLDACVNSHMDPALVVLLQKKLCRRLAKLEQLVDGQIPGVVQLLGAMASIFKGSVANAQRFVDREYSEFKAATIRKVPILPPRIPLDSPDLCLSLPSSRTYLSSLLASGSYSQQSKNNASVKSQGSFATLSCESEAYGTRGFAQGVLRVSRTIKDADAIATRSGPATDTAIHPEHPEVRCSVLYVAFQSLLEAVHSMTKGDPGHNSRFLLTVFDLWVAMDAAAAQACPLLKYYCPVFSPDLLNVFQLPDVDDMKRLRRIQSYLESRRLQCNYANKTIFSRLDQDSFGTRYAQSSPRMIALHQSIKSRQTQNRKKKTKELENACKQYDRYSENILKHECCCTFNADGTKNVNKCIRCFNYRKRKRMTIDVSEDLLPEDESLAAAVVFELAIPQYIAQYRDMTWAILTRFAYPTLPVSESKIHHLREHLPLAEFSTSSDWPFNLSMASHVKSFGQTHYKKQKMKISIERVLVPLASQFFLYDPNTKVWVKSITERLTLAHWCGIHIPSSLATTVLPVPSHPAPNPDGPTSYAAVANRPECPEDMSVHEFEAFQRLLSGNSRRWLTMLTELGSSNLNFSKLDTMLVFTQLANQAGPLHQQDASGLHTESRRDEIRGPCHAILTDDRFVQRLLEEMGTRLAGIRGSWRETNAMDVLITLALRVHALAEGDNLRKAALSFLQLARSTTLRWIHTLGRDVETTTDGDAAHRRSMYAFKAALTCRRTFSIFAKDAQKMSALDVSDFLCASLALQQNLVVDIHTLPLHDRNAIRQDCILASELKERVRAVIDAYPDAAKSAVAYGLGFSDTISGMASSSTEEASVGLKILPWQFLDGKNDGWMTSIVNYATDYSNSAQRIDLHYIDGHLLVDGKPAGKLPQDIRDSEDVKELFENSNLLAYPSYLPEMSYRLIFTMQSHQVHFGRRDGRVIIVTKSRAGIREYVPRRIFISQSGVYDLPRVLVDDCVHWYDKRSEELEFRRKTSTWKSKPSDWKLNVRLRQAHRRRVRLADPHSRIFKLMTEIFNHFEDLQRLVVYQTLSKAGSLSVELRHLDLTFFVNNSGRLECRQLRTEVDPDQDAGTLYGFQSMIVMRDISDHARRSIITPMGVLEWVRSGVHFVTRTAMERSHSRSSHIRAKNESYARFSIDTILGRLTCPPEPLLLYTKAQLHAFTSCPLPDPLTGRTGDEEAVHTLTSGRCQPWTVISDACISILHQIMMLAPNRQFYPKDMRVLQDVKWDKFLPADVQKDRYGRLGREIYHKFRKLSCFSPKLTSSAADQNEIGDPRFEDDSDFLLQKRGEVQRLRFDNPQAASETFLAAENMDLQYNSSGCVGSSSSPGTRSQSFTEAGNAVYEISQILCNHPLKIPAAQHLPNILAKWKLIGGFHSPCDTERMPLATFMDNQTFGERWGGLVELCRTAAPEQEFSLIFSLALLAFSPGADMDAIRLLAAYTYLPGLKTLQPPRHMSFSGFHLNEKLTVERLEALISTSYAPYGPASHPVGGRKAVLEPRRRETHAGRCKEAAMRLAIQVWGGWPEDTPSARGFTSDVISVKAALKAITPEWERLRRNQDLSDYAAKVEALFAPSRKSAKKKVQKARSAPVVITRTLVPARRTAILSLLRDVACRDMEPLPKNLTSVLSPQASFGNTNSTVQETLYNGNGRYSIEVSELRQIVGYFLASSNSVRQVYAQDLNESLDALERHEKQHRTRMISSGELPSISEIAIKIGNVTEAAKITLNHLMLLFSRQAGVSGGPVSGRSNEWLQQCGLYPRLTAVTLLELLRSDTTTSQFGQNVKQWLVLYGCVITKLQRLHRVRRFLQGQDMQRALAEWQNSGHENWKPEAHTDWLLMEIDSDMLIRPEQVEVARAIIAPNSQSNSVMQLNMGKGKTSCIVPMAMAILADGQRLARLIVPKALLLPTAQMVQSRLGGLVGRELRHVPFSRRTATGSTAKTLIQAFKEHHEELKQNRGILLASPEHILAFKLSGLQCLADGKTKMAKDMISFQSQLARGMCRDVLDESDFTLAVRTQLVYPSGQLTAVDGAPHRWKLIQALLSLVEDNLPALCQDFPHSIGVEERPDGGFPMIYVLSTDIQQGLHRMIVQDISRGRVPFFRPAPDKTESKQKIQAVVSPEEVTLRIEQALSGGSSDTAVRNAAALFYDAGSVSDGLLLVRGLLANNILLTCLKKRWNVQYGLHPNRWPIAVPFEAKGVPSERSEFGHPDVAILFTCLAFYYAGLTKTQLRDGLQHILQHADDPAIEYERWTAGSGAIRLPDELMHWNVISVDDEGQVETLWKHLRFTRPVIDHYLNTFVFPVHARQFSVKLQASAWDLPLFNPGESTSGGQPSAARTTGFSGTNDNKMMLPLTIKQDDLPSLRQTNAEVLTYLLQPRNRGYVCTGSSQRRWSEEQLIQSLVVNNIRILIDAGAYILEKTNESLARAWLLADSQRPAAVFFGEGDNRAWVLFRDSTARKAPLVATPFVDRLDECLIYFDEAHTRGVDLQLPLKARGALTLALGQTKDHTVQAAMRLRQLGTTQSVVFYAPPEVDQSIRDACGSIAGSASRTINSSHVVTWLLEQTCQANEQLHPLYLSHGWDFCKRSDGQWNHGDHLEDCVSRTALVKVLEQPERQTLAQLYGNQPSHRNTTKLQVMPNDLQRFAAELWAQKQAAVANEGLTGGTGGTGAFEEVEQEREVEVQVEQIRVRERGSTYTALSFPGVSRELRIFIQTGALLPGAWREQAFAFIARTNIGARYGVQTTESALYVSAEFGRTIQPPKKGGQRQDDFLRPVEWVVWCPSTGTALVVIPEELELLVPLIRESKCVHLLSYAAPVTRAMVAFGSLQYFSLPPLPEGYCFPSWLVVELGILAGRLYTTFDESTALGEYVRRPQEATFCRDPVGFLLEWLSLRRVGQDIMHTPAAYVCQGRPLRKDHAFFSGWQENTMLGSSEASRTTSGSEPMSSEDTGSESEGDEDDGVEELTDMMEQL